MSFLFRRKERTKEKSWSAECFRRGKDILTLVHQRSFSQRSKHARLTACSKFCATVYPFHQPLRAWSPSPSKRWRLTTVRQPSILHRSKRALSTVGRLVLRRDNPSVAFGASSLYTREPYFCARTFYFASFKRFSRIAKITMSSAQGSASLV